MKSTVFIIGTVWVEPKASAAGSRMMQLIDYFQDQNYQVVFGTTAQKNPNSFALESKGVSTFEIELNSGSFDELIVSISPEIVVFDRFMSEEQFGWRVAENLPNAIRILDTEDLHCLRKTRQKKYQLNEEFQLSDLLVEDITKREMASILRCDLSLIISQFEMRLLKELFHIDDSLLIYLPFLLEKMDTTSELIEFEKRAHFVSMGNFLHAPNLDAVIRLKKEIWSGIRKQLPKAELHVYGAYPTQQILEFQNIKEGFFVHGYIEDQNQVFQKARVLLAPLNFGAGLKGKFIDAMKNGCPSITTSIGNEGFSNQDEWNGFVEDHSSGFIDQSIQLYTDEKTWYQKQSNGFRLLNQFVKEPFYKALNTRLAHLLSNLPAHRKNNFLGSLLQHHTLKSTKYMSKWIEEKSRAKA